MKDKAVTYAETTGDLEPAIDCNVPKRFEQSAFMQKMRGDRAARSVATVLAVVALSLQGWAAPNPELPAAPVESPPDRALVAMAGHLRAANEAFLADDFATALTEIGAAAELRSGGAENRTVREAEQLLSVSAGLRNQNEPELAAKVGLLAVERLKAASGKLGRAEQAQALRMQAQALDFLIVDRSRAMAAYVEALAVDESNAEARRGLEQLEAQEAAGLRKAVENDVARERARAGDGSK